ncbi:amidohydrolase family protein [Glycomyces harbinensis]|uniref:Cytosine deaminase n=1 Tax=Glycomyces harbinensis TaxID=58114 RepID=A0A1G6Z7T8_9ACTN|nr:amidohydrolase family protein [Glycomyces harbinensis]SDD98532.1 cytosine deaminase [Glycomyces harbinensis]
MTAPVPLTAVTGATTPDGPADLRIGDGRVTRVDRPASDPPGTVENGGPRAATHPTPGLRETPESVALAAAGRVVLPAFVDAHVHLDKAYLLPAVEDALAAEGAELTADLSDAIATVARLRPHLPAGLVAAGAQRAVDTLSRNGTVAARAMVEIDPATGLGLLDLHRDLADRNADRIGLQLVAFPQRGLEPPGQTGLMAAAMVEGAAVVGGCPYVDTDPAAHLDFVFDLAERTGAPVDLHLDFSDDPSASQIDLVAERTRALGFAGRVAIGHATTLAAMEPAVADKAFAALAGAGIALAVMPATDLYLAGHPRPSSAGFATRSVAPLLRAAELGVRVSITNNNLCNPFAPYGNGSQIQAAWLAGILFRAVGRAERRVLLDAITANPAAVLGLPGHGPAAGARADLVVIEADRVEDVIVQSAPVAAVVKDGALVHGA